MTRNLLICYGTRYGSTAEVAEKMAETAREIGVAVDLVDLKRNKIRERIQDYDLIVIGSGILGGRWTKEPLKFIEDNLDVLSKAKVAIFVVCGFAAREDKCETAQVEYLDHFSVEFPGLSPVLTGLFAGVFDFKKYSFPVRALVKRMIKRQIPSGEEVPDKIDYRNWHKIREWITGLLST